MAKSANGSRTMHKIIVHASYDADIPAEHGGPDLLWSFERSGWPLDQHVLVPDVVFVDCRECQRADGATPFTHEHLGDDVKREVATENCLQHNAIVTHLLKHPARPRVEVNLREPDVLEIARFSRSKLWKEIYAGRFPRARKCAGVNIWTESEVRAALDALTVKPDSRKSKRK